ncbi:MAG: helix-turn-helix domain-containing protein [Victivallales bacterium]|nr:helix-turn-helix domain-containing protein [Victivallales bacterium]
MQFFLEQLLTDFEEAFGCRLTLHDPMHLLGSHPELGPLLAKRTSHRKTFPTMCGREMREYCISHCMFQFNRWAERTHRPLYFMHCKNGFWQLAVPVFRNNVHVLSFFAGLWSRFDDTEKIRRIARMLPIFSEGVLHALENNLRQKPLPTNPTAARIHSFIADNYNRPLQTRDLARHLALSVSRTCAIVQDTCKQSFKTLLCQERIRHAKLYLAQTDLRIKEIALLCGFASPEHFVRTFQHILHTTPARWRNSPQPSPQSFSISENT